MIILLSITAILAIANFAFIMYRSYINFKIPGFYPEDRWETETVRKPEKIEIEVRVRDVEDPGIYFLLKDNKCSYEVVEDIDFKQEVELDSVISKGELLLEQRIVVFGSRDKTWLELKKKSDGKKVVMKMKSLFKSNAIKRTGRLSRNYDTLTADEIMISIEYDLLYKENYIGKRQHFDKKLAEIYENIIDEQYYRIFIQLQTDTKGKMCRIQGNDLKELHEYRILSRDRSDEAPVRRKSLVDNEEILFDLKMDLMFQQIRVIPYRIDDSEEEKEDYLDFLIDIIETYPGKDVPVFRGCLHKIDQYAVTFITNEFLRTKFVKPDRFTEFCNKMIKTAQNTETKLQAYAAKTSASLMMNDLDAADKIALKALKLKKHTLFHKHVDEILYGQPALLCIRYIINEKYSPAEISKYIDKYYRKSSKLPVFRNNLLFIKAIMTDLSDKPLKSVIKAYEKVDYDIKEDHEEYQYLQGLNNVKAASSAIRFINQQTDVDITINKPVYVKKHLLSNDSKIMNEAGSLDVTVIQHGFSSEVRQIVRKNPAAWKKGIIDGKIYWFTADSRNK